ncbi:MAG: hypothetical protein WBO17_07805 [Sphingorhabdus sp.]
MTEPKPIASLSGILLARKGAARPAMRRPTMMGNFGSAALAQDDLGWNDMGYDVDPDPNTPMDYEHDTHGQNPLAAAVPDAKSDVRYQQERLAAEMQAGLEAGFDSFEGELPSVASALTVVTMTPEPPVKPVAKRVKTDAPRSRARSAPGLKGKAAFTLRLDSERHLKLRLACAVRHQSAQNLVTDALDAFLESMPEIGQLAANVPVRKH